MKTFTVTTLFGKYLFLLLFMGVGQAQIPVTDGANLAQQIQQVLSWEQQLRAMSDSYNQQLQQIKSITGNRGLGNLFNNPALKQYLSPEWQQVYNNLHNQGLAGLTSGAQALRQQYGSNYSCVKYQAGTKSRQICESQTGKNFQDADVFNTALQSANSRTQIISALQGEINNTNDPKAIAELQARIQAEQANLQNEMSKMQLSIQLAEIQSKIINQLGGEEIKKQMDRRPFSTQK